MYVTPEIILGFHGCDQSVFNEVIVKGETLRKSENTYDWLGHGVYFWEGSYERALEWAKNNKEVKEPAVIGAFIKLGECLDLLDSEHLDKVKIAHDILTFECNAIGEKLPTNKVFVNGFSFVRELDCKVILRLQQLNNEIIAESLNLTDTHSGDNKRKIQNSSNYIDTVRGMFPEGKELYEGAGFRSKNHIQLCVVNPNSIVGYFRVPKKNSWYKNV